MIDVSILVAEKVRQAISLLAEFDIDCWLTFVRETTPPGSADPVLPLILGQHLTWQSALLIERSGQTVAIVGKYEDQPVREAGQGAWKTVLPYVQSIRSPLNTVLKQINPRQVAVNFSMDDVTADGLSHGMMLLLREYLAGTPYVDRLVSAQRLIGALRGRKSPEELRRISRAITITQEILNSVATFARLGISELQFAEFMHRQLDARRVATAWDRRQCPIVTNGPGSTVGHAAPSAAHRLEAGSILHIDFGARFEGYCADMQRCWYAPVRGETSVPPAVQRGFDTVVAAIQAAFARLRPGTPGCEVDDAARKVITDAGYPEFQHATGHSVGMAAHDGGIVLGPRWERYGQTPMLKLEPGNVVTLELGIDNLDGRGYLGLEEMAVVTPDGPRWLTTPQTSLPLLPFA